MAASNLNNLDAYGRVVQTWLRGSLDLSRASAMPVLQWLDSDFIYRRMGGLASNTEVDATLRATYTSALLAIAQEKNQSYTSSNFQQYYQGTQGINGSPGTPPSTTEQLIILNLSSSITSFFDEKGIFNGKLTLVDANGAAINSVIHGAYASPYTFKKQTQPGQGDALVLLLKSPAPEGSSIQIDFNNDSRVDLKTSSLKQELVPFSDRWDLKAFQMGVRSQGQTSFIPGRESTQEGLLDLEQDLVILTGTGLGLSTGSLVQFSQTSQLPDNLYSYDAYTVTDLKEIAGETRFQLTDRNTGEHVDLAAPSQALGATPPPGGQDIGLRLAMAKLEERTIMDFGSSPDTNRISVDPQVLQDVVLEVRNPKATTSEAFAQWTAVPLTDAKASYGNLRFYLNSTSTLAAIPDDWDFRLSYDDLKAETIPQKQLDLGVYLNLDEALFNTIIGNTSLSATLKVGPEGVSGQDISITGIQSFASVKALLSKIDELASWANKPSNFSEPSYSNPPLFLTAPTGSQGLPNFRVDLQIQHSGGSPERVYNPAQLVRPVNTDGTPVAPGSTAAANLLREGKSTIVDPDGFSLWLQNSFDNSASNANSSNGLVQIDRYGDQQDRLGLVPQGSTPPQWSDYHPQLWINSDVFQPWEKQRILPKTIQLEGQSFDGGEDAVLRLSVEIPDNEDTSEWDGSFRDYVILLDLHQAGNGKLNEEEKSAIFDNETFGASTAGSEQAYNPLYYYAKDFSGSGLSAEAMLAAIKESLTAFFAANPSIPGLANPAFSLSTSNREVVDQRQVLTASIDFPAPIGSSTKPSISLFGHLLQDSSNDVAFQDAQEAFQTFSGSGLQEWVNNYGDRPPQFTRAWTNPLDTESDASDRCLYVDYNGLESLAPLAAGGSTYTRGDIKLMLDNRLVDPSNYDVSMRWNHQLLLRFTQESSIRIEPSTQLTFQLNAGHGFRDSEGNALDAGKVLNVENFAAWQAWGFDPDREVLLDEANSSVDGKKITLTFLGSGELSNDSSKAKPAESDDFQFWQFNPMTGTQTQLQLSSSSIEVDGQSLIFSLSEAIPSGIQVQVTYDPALSQRLSPSTGSSDPFTNSKGVEARAFYWQQLRNLSPDQEGPTLRWGSVAGMSLHLRLEDPAGLLVDGQELDEDHLPQPSEFSLQADLTPESGSTASTATRTISVNSITLTPWGELELQLDKSVQTGERVSLNYVGTSLTDSLGNVASIRQVELENNSQAFDESNAATWFQNLDLTNVVFSQSTGGITGSGRYLNENGSVSNLPDEFQIQDEYAFRIDQLSTIKVNLTDIGGTSLDDAGDANLDLSLENTQTRTFIGGSWNSKQDNSWGPDSQATNDERNTSFILPPGDYRLRVHHADLERPKKQSYQLEISKTPYSLAATTLDTSTSSPKASASLTLNANETVSNIYLKLNDAGSLNLKASNGTGTISSFINLFDLNGQWIEGGPKGTLEHYLLDGYYRVEIHQTNASSNSEPTLLATLDSAIVLETDTDSRTAPSGSIAIDGLPSQGKLNALDQEDSWGLTLTGGKIYTIRATGFSEDVNLILDDASGLFCAGSWNWGKTESSSGAFTPSDETIVIDLSSGTFSPGGHGSTTPGIAPPSTGHSTYEAGKQYRFTVSAQVHGTDTSAYSLIAKQHSTLDEANKEASKGIISYDDIFSDLFENDNPIKDRVGFNKDELLDLTSLENPSLDELEQLKAKLEKAGFQLSGNPLAYSSILGSRNQSGKKEISPILISKDVPSSAIPADAANKLKEPGELSSQGGQEDFDPQDVAALLDDTKDTVETLKPVTKPIGVSVESRQKRLAGFLAQDATGSALIADGLIGSALEDYDLGLQRLSFPLSDDLRATLAESNTPPGNNSSSTINPQAKTVVWYKNPSGGKATIFTWDAATSTGSRLEDTDSTKAGPDVLAVYIQDGGRGDDDGLINGEILAPGGLALVSLIQANNTPDPITRAPLDWNNNQSLDINEARATMRFLLGTFPADVLTGELPGVLGSRFGTSKELQDHLRQVITGSNTANLSTFVSPLDIDRDGKVHPLQDGLLMALGGQSSSSPAIADTTWLALTAPGATVKTNADLMTHLHSLVNAPAIT